MSAACAISWSAGKDSWLALMRAREQGLRVDTFVTMCDEDGTSKSHALAPDLVGAQVRALRAHRVRVSNVDAGPLAPSRLESHPSGRSAAW